MVHIQWDDWQHSLKPHSNQDIDAYLFVADGNGKPLLWARSENRQDGSAAALPLEMLSSRKPPPGGVAYLLLKPQRIDREMKVRVAVSRGAQIIPQQQQPPFSLGSPASAQHVLSVGALDVQSKDIADYSSWGPSWDGRLKPEVVAPAGTSSVAYQNRFHGTSAAAPHTTGFAALLQSQNNTLRGEQLHKTLMRSVKSLGQPQPNNTYGHGLIIARKKSSPERDDAPDVPNNNSATEDIQQVLDDILNN